MSAGATLLIDNSAWARLTADGPEPARAAVAGWIRQRRLVASLPFLLEVGYSARGASDHAALMDRLRALPYAALDDAAERGALDGQAQLARQGHHRLPPVDLLIAALAHRNGHGVLHCDRHYDLIAERTSLTFGSVWLPGAG